VKTESLLHCGGLLLAFIVDFRCFLCNRVDICPAVSYTVCATSHIKAVVVNLASPDVS